MIGYIFNYYKYIRVEESISKFLVRSEDNENLDMLPEQSLKSHYITFGEFDRLEVNKVTDFTRFRDLSEISKKWKGDRVPILLYEIDETNDVSCNDEGQFIIKENDQTKANDKLFIGLTIFQFRYNQIKNESDISDFIKNYKEEIIETLKTKNINSNIKFSIFGTLGTNGIAILWLADQYEEILDCINYLKGHCINENSGTNLFLSARTIFSKNNVNEKEFNEKISNIKGKALFQITVKTCLNKKIKNLIEENLEINTGNLHCAGEYDLILLIDVSNIYNKFDKGNFLHCEGQFHSENILQTNVRLCRDENIFLEVSENKVDEDTEEKDKEEDKKKHTLHSELLKVIKEVDENYNKLRNQLKRRYPKTAGMVDTLDLLYCDFNSKVSSAVHEMWAIDFAYQFNGIIKCVTKFTENLEKGNIDITSQDYLELVKEIFNNFKHQVFHIAESNHLNFEPPICHLRYTGHCNLVLYAYFGIIKNIIKLIYSFQEVNKQSEIIPLITVDTMPIVESTLFVDYNNPQDSRIITINLPEASLFDLPRYIVFLYHELFHYAVPKDRYSRDKLLGIIYINEVLKSFIILYIISKTGIKEEEIEYDKYIYILKGCLTPITYNFTIENYEEINENIVQCNTLESRYQDIDKTEFAREIYEKTLYNFVIKMFDSNLINKKNIIEDYLKYLILNKDKIEKNIEHYIPAQMAYDKKKNADKINAILNKCFNLENNDTIKIEEDISIKRVIDEIPINSESVFTQSYILLEALKEVSADIPMIELSKLNVVSYLIFCTIIKKNLLIEPNYEDKVDHIRIGIVIDYLLEFGKREKDLAKSNNLEEFINIYIGLYFKSTSLQNNNVEKEYFDLKEEATKWFTKYTKIYVNFLKEYTIYRKVFQEYYKLESLKERNNVKYIEYIDENKEIDIIKYCEIFKNYGVEIEKFIKAREYNKILGKKKVLDEEIFKMNIELIQKFQYYTDFIKIAELRDKNYKSEEKYKGSIVIGDQFKANTADKNKIKLQKGFSSWTYKVDTIPKLCLTINELASRLVNEHKLLDIHNSSLLWYRGHKTNKGYKLIPALMRNFKEKKKYYDTLENYQMAEFEEFKFRADGAPEFGGRSDLSICDYLAIMQHYSVPTTFLDWSEDAWTALYFALEPYLDSSKKREKSEEAVLYIFSPNLYNKAI